MTEQVALRAHGLGGNDAEQLVEGMSIQSLEGPSQSYFDDMLQSEITVMTSAIPADTSGGGIRLNSVLKDGGNIFSGAAFLGFSSGAGSPTTSTTAAWPRPTAFASANGIKHIHMFSASFGGPIRRNRAVVPRSRRGTSRQTSSSPMCPAQIVAPDGEFINSYLDTYVRGPSVRLTWQAAQNHKIAMFASRWWKRKGKDFAAGTDPRVGPVPRSEEGASLGRQRQVDLDALAARFLLEAGYSVAEFDWHGGPCARRAEGARNAGVVHADAERPTRSGRSIRSARTTPAARRGARSSVSGRTTRATSSTGAFRT